MDKPPAPGFQSDVQPGYAPPPYSSSVQPPPPQAQTFVVHTAPIAYGPTSQRMTCPHCQATISTRVEAEANMKTHIVALILCVLGLWCCSPCPYCMDSCLAQKHYCPSCKSYLGEASN